MRQHTPVGGRRPPLPPFCSRKWREADLGTIGSARQTRAGHSAASLGGRASTGPLWGEFPSKVALTSRHNILARRIEMLVCLRYSLAPLEFQLVLHCPLTGTLTRPDRPTTLPGPVSCKGRTPRRLSRPGPYLPAGRQRGSGGGRFATAVALLPLRSPPLLLSTPGRPESRRERVRALPLHGCMAGPGPRARPISRTKGWLRITLRGHELCVTLTT
jgi:hypothetical protein